MYDVVSREVHTLSFSNYKSNNCYIHVHVITCIYKHLARKIFLWKQQYNNYTCVYVNKMSPYSNSNYLSSTVSTFSSSYYCGVQLTSITCINYP